MFHRNQNAANTSTTYMVRVSGSWAMPGIQIQFRPT